MIRKILLGTENPSKLTFFQPYFTPAGVEVITPNQIGCSCACPEDARTPEGNAMQKARAWHKASGMPVFAQDSGLVFLDLPEDHPDQPGTHVRRPRGVTLDDDAMLAYYIELVRRHDGKLRAAWQDAVCLCLDDETCLTLIKPREMLEESAFLLVDSPVAARHKGWPLDSMSINIKTGRYYLDEEDEEQPVETETRSAWREVIISWLCKHLSEASNVSTSEMELRAE